MRKRGTKNHSFHMGEFSCWGVCRLSVSPSGVDFHWQWHITCNVHYNFKS